MTNQKKFSYLAIVLVALLCIVFGIRSLMERRNPEHKKSEATKALEDTFKYTEVVTGELPPGMPAEWILEKDMVVTNQYTSKGAGYMQSTLQYESKLSVLLATGLYTRFFEKNGWKLQSRVNKENFQSIDGKKGLDKISLVVNENDITKVVTVDLTFMASYLDQLPPVQ